MMKKTILELDLVGYSDKARELEEHLGVDLVMRFNDQIQEFIDLGLLAAGLQRDDVVVQSTGDGAIVVLDEARQAHVFAEAINSACREHNAAKSVQSAQRWFRIAAASGEVEIRESDLAGTTIANAVRLESAGEVGHFLVDVATWEQLPAEFQKEYLPEEVVRGKRDELIAARRRIFLEDAQPRPDHVTLTMNLSRDDFSDLAAKALVREITAALGVTTSKITIEAIRSGSIEVVLRFQDAASLARFINRHVSGDAILKEVLREWKVQKVGYHAELKVHASSQGTSEPANQSGSNAVDVWRERLNFLRAEQAKAAEATAKFKLIQDIDEARQKLRELGAGE